LRELDTVRSFAQTPGNTVVLGVGGVMPLARNKEQAVNAGGGEPTDAE